MDIILKNINKSFDEKPVLENFNGVFLDKQINYIMGKSGCGKTTLLNLILGIEKSDSGEITGVENRKISVVFQEDRLCESFNLIRNIKLVTNHKSSFIKSELKKVGLEDEYNKPVSSLSGGMKRRLALVRAMVYDSDILIMDEPLKGLDESTKKTVLDYIKTNIKNKLVIMITHDEEETLYIKGTILKM